LPNSCSSICPTITWPMRARRMAIPTGIVVADNDLALGRILNISRARNGGGNAVFVTETMRKAASITSTRTARSALRRSAVQEELRLARQHQLSRPAQDHSPAAGCASLKPLRCSGVDLADCFASRPDTARYQALPVDKRIFDPPPPTHRAAGGQGRGWTIRGKCGSEREGSAPFTYTPFPPGFPYRSTIKKR